MLRPRPETANEGLLGNVASGYRLAWTFRRPLSAVLLPVVAAVILMSALLDLALGDDRLVIVDGVVRPGSADVLAWAKLVAAVSLWLIGLIAGGWTVARGNGPVEALWHGVKHLPAFLLGLAAALGCLFVALRVVKWLPTNGLVPVLIIGVLVVAALTAARVLLAGISWAVRGSDRMPGWTEAGSFLLGGVTVPTLLAYVLGRLGAVAYLDIVFVAVLMIGGLAAQVGVATRPHVYDLARQRPVRMWPGAAMAAVAVLVSVGVVVVNPYDAPSLRTHNGGPAGPVAVAWPAGQHPVIVHNSGVWFCDDDMCEDFTDVSGGPVTIDGYGTAGIALDGTVVKTAVTGGHEKGGPFVRYARCMRDGCQEAYLPVRASASEKLDEQAPVEVAGAAAPDGALWFFVAAPIKGGKLGRYRFLLIRCAEVTCAAPQRHQLSAEARTPDDGYPDGRRAQLSVGADGRPVASFWFGWSVYRYSCEPVTCAGVQHSATDAGPPGAVWDTAGDRTVAFRAPGVLHDGDRSTVIVGSAAEPSGALTVAGPLVYVAAAVPSGPDSGFHLSVGEPATYWRQTVWRCEQLDCVSSPMDVYAGDPRRELLAVAEDGRVLVVRDNRIVLLTTPFA